MVYRFWRINSLLMIVHFAYKSVLGESVSKSSIGLNKVSVLLFVNDILNNFISFSYKTLFCFWLAHWLARINTNFIELSTLVSHFLSLLVRCNSPSMLQCDNCTSHKSLEDCEKSQIKFTCGPSISHRCFTLRRISYRLADPNKTKEDLHMKGCFAKYVCDLLPQNYLNISHCGYGINETVHGIETCSFTCFTGTVLHFTPTPVGSGPELHGVSVIMILACILLAFEG